MINPNDVNTVRVGQLPDAAFNLTDKIPHEVGADLKSGTVQSLADFLTSYISVTGGVGFRAVSVADGETLPTTTQEEFILVGAGTFYNVSGGATIVCTEELNALVSNGSYWFIGVEIPINVELAGITQFIRTGFVSTTPSENAVFNALALKANLSDLNTIRPVSKRYAGSGQSYVIPSGAVAFKGWINESPQDLESVGFESDLLTFTQSGSTVTFKKAITLNARVRIDYTL